MKRWVSFIVSVFLVFSCTSMNVFAVDEGTVDDTGDVSETVVSDEARVEDEQKTDVVDDSATEHNESENDSFNDALQQETTDKNSVNLEVSTDEEASEDASSENTEESDELDQSSITDESNSVKVEDETGDSDNTEDDVQTGEEPVEDAKPTNESVNNETVNVTPQLSALSSNVSEMPTLARQVANPGETVNIGDVDGDYEISGDGIYTVTGNSSDDTRIVVNGGNPTLNLSDSSVSIGGLSSDIALVIGGNSITTVVLNGNNTLTGQGDNPGVLVESGSTLIIQGPGTLYSNAGETFLDLGFGSAGIQLENDSNLIINGGTIVARGDNGGSGIGSPYQSSGECNATIKINDGIVKAYSGNGYGIAHGAGIGGGANVSFTGSIEISGGLVYAQGHGIYGTIFDEYSPSIGSGSHRIDEDDRSGSFIINGFATLIAPNGILPVNEINAWSGFVLTNVYSGNEQEVSENSVSYDGNTFTFNDSVTNVVGNIAVPNGKSVNIGSNATMYVRQSGPYLSAPANDLINSSVLSFENGSKLTGSGTLNVDGVVELHDGVSQVSGNGRLTVDQDGTGGVLKVKLTEELITFDSTVTKTNDIYQKYYDGEPFSSEITVKLNNLWGYSTDYIVGTDYVFTGLNEVQPNGNSPYTYAGSVDVANDSAHLLENGTKINMTYRILANYTWDLPSEYTIAEHADTWLSDLPKVGTGNQHYPLTSNPGNQTVSLNGQVTWYSDENRGVLLTDEYIKNYITANPNATELMVYWRFTQQGTINSSYATSIFGSLKLIISENPIDLRIYQDTTNVETLSYAYGDEFELTAKGSYNDGTEVTELHDVKWEVLCGPDTANLSACSYISISDSNVEGPVFTVADIPSDNRNVYIRVSVPEHYKEESDGTIAENHGPANSIVPVSLLPKEINVIYNENISQTYSQGNTKVNVNLAKFEIVPSDLVGTDVVDLEVNAKDLPLDYVANQTYPIKVNLSIKDAEGLSVAYRYKLKEETVTLIVTITEQPKEDENKSSEDEPVGTWDDGGPFTTDECGSVYDRWGNLIYQGVCGVTTGFQLVNTSDN